MSDLRIQTFKSAATKLLATPITTAPLVAGYYKLFFETGCGFENDTDPVKNATNNARRLVLKQVFEDLSAFINSTLTASGNKVNIWVRNITNAVAPNPTTGILGAATSFYNIPRIYSGTIIDSEIWKTIHLGNNSYINFTYPGIFSTNNSNDGYYHGFLTFNFSDSSINWNTNLNATANLSQYDLYSVILHEVTHALGFESLIDKTGNSNFGYDFKYYSRYDRFLKNNNLPTGSFLLNNNNNSCSMYNYDFNSNLTSTLQPSLNCPNPTIYTDELTNCATAIKYISTTNDVAVYRPNCFQPGSSLSHFEDSCYTNPANGQNTVNNQYFVMSNANDTGSLYTKRFLKPEERNVLADIGYSVNNIYGNTAQLSYKNYGGVVTTGINVAGRNDGFDGTKFVNIQNFTAAGLPIPFIINNILSNDINANAIECVQDISKFSTITSSNTSITFSSTQKGVHILRYVPLNTITGQRGNVTYIYVYVQENEYGGIATNDCNLVVNGDFEQHVGLPTTYSQFNGVVTNWKTVFTNDFQSNEYYHVDGVTSFPSLKIPCTWIGYENDKFNKMGYIGMCVKSENDNNYNEIVKTKLRLPLLPNKDYRLTFDISLADKASSASKIQAYISTEDITVSYFNNGVYDFNLPVSDLTMLKTNNSYSVLKNGWERITMQFTTGSVASQQYLYLGGIKNSTTTNLNVSINSPSVPSTCIISGNLQAQISYYYLDNVELFPVITPKITGSTAACLTLPNANITSNSTTLLSGQTATWSITGGAGTLTGANTTTANVTWTTLPGILKLTITDTATGCTNFITRTIESNCLPCSCLSFPYLTENSQLSDSRTYSLTHSGIGNTICNSVRYTWNWSDGTSTETTTPYNGTDLSVRVLKNVIIKQYISQNILLCSVTVWLNGAADSRSANSNITTTKPKERFIDFNNISLTPNPSKGIFTLKTQDVIGLATIIVNDLNGRQVFESREILEKEKTIDLSKFQSGIYLLKVTGDNIDFTEKLIKN